MKPLILPLLFALSACAQGNARLIVSHMGDPYGGDFRLHAEQSKLMSVEDCMAVASALRRTIADSQSTFDCLVKEPKK